MVPLCCKIRGMKIILGLTGEKLGGKDTVAEYLMGKYGAVNIRHSSILDEILSILDMPVSRRNEIDLGMAMRQMFGLGILNRAVAKKVRESTASLVVINGIRFEEELENARALGARIVYVTAPSDARFARFLKRQEKADDAMQTREQFDRQEHEPTEVQIPHLGRLADFRIDNTGTLEQLYKNIDDIIVKARQ